MSRANRNYLPGYLWHITHRCHKKDFLLKFGRDRDCWLKWLFEAKKRYGLVILNYAVTSNHIHLLVYGNEDCQTIPRSIQLIAGNTAQQYNKRKNRKGAFWEDRYHATAIESGKHFRRCLTYIDMNMVRTGTVRHPSTWAHCGFVEIQNPPMRYKLIDNQQLAECLGLDNVKEIASLQKKLVEAELSQNNLNRQTKWTQCVAVGSEQFVEDTRKKLGLRARHRQIIADDDSDLFLLKETHASYNCDFKDKNDTLSQENTHLWEKIS